MELQVKTEPMTRVRHTNMPTNARKIRIRMIKIFAFSYFGKMMSVKFLVSCELLESRLALEVDNRLAIGYDEMLYIVVTHSGD